MVDIAQLVERQIVALEVKGSRPFIHPIKHLKRCFFCCLLGLELSVKKVASGKFFSAGEKASIDPQREAYEAERDPLFTPLSTLKGAFFVAYWVSN